MSDCPCAVLALTGQHGGQRAADGNCGMAVPAWATHPSVGNSEKDMASSGAYPLLRTSNESHSEAVCFCSSTVKRDKETGS